VHPGLLHAPFQAWALLSRQMEDMGVGELGSPASADTESEIGLLGYRVTRVEKDSLSTATVYFQRTDVSDAVVSKVPAGSRPFHPFPLEKSSGFLPSGRFLGLLTCILQGHALNMDISIIPSALPSTGSCSTSLLVKTFSEILGYDMESIHLYKDIGGRELVMRRKIESDGGSSWEPR
jgi:von Willebrand factor A domain-containing protein 8